MESIRKLSHAQVTSMPKHIPQRLRCRQEEITLPASMTMNQACIVRWVRRDQESPT